MRTKISKVINMGAAADGARRGWSRQNREIESSGDLEVFNRILKRLTSWAWMCQGVRIGLLNFGLGSSRVGY